MRAFSFLAVFAIVLATAFASPRHRLNLGSKVPKEILSKHVAATDFERVMDQSVISWAQAQLEVLFHSQQLEGLLTSSGHGDLWGPCQEIISKANAEANAVFDEAVKAADPTKEIEALVELFSDALNTSIDILTEAMDTIRDIIASEANDVYQEAQNILYSLVGQVELAFMPLFTLLIEILWPEHY